MTPEALLRTFCNGDMHRVILDTESADVKKFLRALPIDPETVALELEGQVIGKIILPDQLSEIPVDLFSADAGGVPQPAHPRISA